MRINHNITAMNAQRQFAINTSSVAKSTEKLSSGSRINSAADDAAGLAISEKMRAQIRGLTMASKNSQDAISLIQTAEGALQETHNILQRMRELAVQSASDTNETSIDRDALNKEFQALISEIDDTASKTKFNDMGLINGDYATNIATAASTGTAHASVWASTKTAAGDYEIKVRTVTIKPEVAAAAATYAVSTSNPVAISAANAAVSATYTAPTTAASSSKINGVWKLGYDGQNFTAKNESTGEIRKASLIGIGKSGSGTIDFGDLGTIAVTNSSATYAINNTDWTSFTGEIVVSGGVTEQKAVTKDVASLNGEEIDLEKGMTKMVFKNSGISVDLSKPYDSAISADVAGTVTVSKASYSPFVVQTGANQGDELRVNIDKMDAYTLGVRTSGVENRLNASAAITQVDNAINTVSTQRAALGALQNRLGHKISNLDTSTENLQAAESRIRDLDFAKEMTNFTKNNILLQASAAMLAQANSSSQVVLQLLQ